MICQNKVGIELELGWDGDILTEIINQNLFWETRMDSSITSRRGISKEIVSRPVRIEDLKKLITEVKNVYRGVIEANESMGLHIHQSFKTSSLERLFMDWEFAKYFTHRLQDEASNGILQGYGNENLSVYERLQRSMRGSVDYYPNFQDRLDYDQHIRRFNTRYKAINYTSLASYNTIETRIFPAFSSSEGCIRAISFTLKVFNEFYRENQDNSFQADLQLTTGKEVITV